MEAYCYVFFYLFLQMCLVWVYYLKTNNPSVVDGSWSIGLMVSGLIYFGFYASFNNLRIMLAFIFLFIWAIRLAGYMWQARIKQNHVDKRYLELSRNWRMNKQLGFFLNFQFQGLLIFGISSVFYFIAIRESASLTVWDIVILLIVGLSILGESIADWQLHDFKKKQEGKVCQKGLWQYSRHPNYFFDWLMWLGFALLGLPAEFGFIGLIAPLIMSGIFLYISIPISERMSVNSRGQAYRDYQETTPKFFPRIH